tara:strand:+ start:117 stop:1196 length:1080 start_codon:yes stop_codon:yes gene_type:complete
MNLQTHLFILGVLLLALIVAPPYNDKIINYTRCSNKLDNITKEIFNKNKINRVNFSDNWKLFIPCTYTSAEKELIKLKKLSCDKIIYAITGMDNLIRKNSLWFYFEKKYGRHISKKYLPNTYILKDKNHMRIFENNYRSDNMYILKKNIQRKKGLKLTYDLNEILLAKNKKYVVVQDYIRDIYLINNRKVNLRAYLLVTCHKGVTKFYFSQLGKCIYANKDYKEKSNHIESHITSLNLNLDIYKKNPLTFLELKKFIGSRKYNILFKKMLDIISKIKEVFSGIICKNSKFDNNLSFQLFGLDFIFNKQFVPLLLELNKGPQMIYYNKKDFEMKQELIHEVLNIAGVHTNSNNTNNFLLV